MSKYINANELKLILNREHLNYSQMIEKKFVLNAIDEMPSVEVKHGEWKDGKRGIVCSECSYGVIAHHNFCPNCGADMRGEQNDRPHKTND